MAEAKPSDIDIAKSREWLLDWLAASGVPWVPNERVEKNNDGNDSGKDEESEEEN